MKKHKKLLIIGIIAVAVIGATLGAVAFAQADDQPGAALVLSKSSTNVTAFMDKVAAIYQQNTGNALDTTALQNAFNEANKQIARENLEAKLQALVDAGKITAQQKQDYLTWLDSRPTTALTDEFKQWLESAPQGFGRGLPLGKGPCFPDAPRGLGEMGKMMPRFGFGR